MDPTLNKHAIRKLLIYPQDGKMLLICTDRDQWLNKNPQSLITLWVLILLIIRIVFINFANKYPIYKKCISK